MSKELHDLPIQHNWEIQYEQLGGRKPDLHVYHIPLNADPHEELAAFLGILDKALIGYTQDQNATDSYFFKVHCAPQRDLFYRVRLVHVGNGEPS